MNDQELDAALAALHADVRTGDGAVARKALLAEVHTPPVARRRVRWLVAAAVVAVLVLGASLVSVFGGPSGATAQASDLLGRSAARTMTVTDPVVGPGEYRYVETHSWYSAEGESAPGVPYAYLGEEVSQVWVPAEVDQEWTQVRTSTGNVQWITGDRPAVPVDPPSSETLRAPRGAFYGPVEGGWQTPDPAFLASLPRDPAALYRRLSADAPDNGRGDAEKLVYAADALRTGWLPADVRAALYRALARLPGLTITDETANLDGRRGIALGVKDPVGSIDEIIIDPGTGAFIGERETDPDGVVRGYTAVTLGVATTAGVMPAG